MKERALNSGGAHFRRRSLQEILCALTSSNCARLLAEKILCFLCLFVANLFCGLCEQGHHWLVEEAVGGEELFVVDVEGFVFKVCDSAACFGDQ